jgi:hypothetical protein
LKPSSLFSDLKGKDELHTQNEIWCLHDALLKACYYKLTFPIV